MLGRGGRNHDDDDTTTTEEAARCGSGYDSACVTDVARGARALDDAELRSRLDTMLSSEILPQASSREENDELSPRTPPLRRSRAPRACTPPCKAAPTQMQSIKVRHRLAKQRRPTWSLSIVNRAPLIVLFDQC